MTSRLARLTTLMLLSVVAMGGSPALAAQRYASSQSSVSSGPCSHAAPCTLSYAMQGAAANDEVIVASDGTYTTGGGGLFASAANLSVHGVPGAPRPTIAGSNPGGTLLQIGSGCTGCTFRDLDIVEASTSGYGVSVADTGVTLDQLTVTSSGSPPISISASGARVLDSVAHLTSATPGSRSAVEISANTPSSVTHTAELRNVTAIADDASGGSAVSTFQGGGGTLTTTMVNDIARGSAPGQDLRAGSGSPINVSFSNYGTASSMVNDGGGHQTTAPVFAGPNDFHESPTSTGTVDRGTNDPLNGPLDPDGIPRDLGAAPDIGAFELPFPSVTTGPAISVAQTQAQIAGLATTYGVTGAAAHVDVGTASGVYTTSTPPVPATSGIGPVAVFTTIPNLQPGTTYFYRLVVGDADGTANGIEQSFTTTAATSPPPPRVGASNIVTVSGIAVGNGGVLRVKVRTGSAGPLRALATTRVLVPAPAPRRGHRRGRARRRTIRYGAAAATAGAPGTLTLLIRPTAAVRRLLAAGRRLSVRVEVTFRPSGAPVNTATARVTVHLRTHGRHRG